MIDFNARTGIITATSFTGLVTGNADTATALDTGRTIGMTGDVVWTSASFDGTGNVTGTSTIQAQAVDVAMLADGVDGELITWSAAGVAATVAVGTANQVLTSGGVGVAPTFEDAAGGGGDVSLTGSPVDNQLAVWTNGTTIEGDAGLTYSANVLTLTNTGVFTISRGVTDVTIANTAAGGDLIYNATINHEFEVGGVPKFEINNTNARFLFNDWAVFLEERGSAGTDLADYGQVWVKDETTFNDLYFTDDIGQDIQLTNNGALAGGAMTDKLTIDEDSGFTANHIAVLQLSATSSGTPAIGIGTSIEFKTETAVGSPGNQEIGAIIASEATVVTGGSEDFDLVFYTMANGGAAAERMRIDELGRITCNTATIPSITTDGLTNTVDIRITGMDENDAGLVLADGMPISFEDIAQANDCHLKNEGVGGGSGTLSLRFDTTGSFISYGGIQVNNGSVSVTATALASPTRINFSNAARIQGSLYMQDQSGADTDIAANGQLWVDNVSPDRLRFTNDNGNDFVVAMAGGLSAVNVNVNSSFDFNSANNFADNYIGHHFDGGNDTITLEDSGSTTNWPLYSTITMICPGSGTITVTEGSGTTLFLDDGSDTVGGVTVSAGVVSITRQTSTDYIIWGSGIT